MNKERYHNTLHCSYLTKYHVIWCPEFRFDALNGNVEGALKQIIQKICDDYAYRMIELEVMPDYIHAYVDVPQTVAPCDVARTLKSISAIELLGIFPQLKQFYARYGTVWSKRNFVSTEEHLTEATIARYAEEHI